MFSRNVRFQVDIALAPGDQGREMYCLNFTLISGLFPIVYKLFHAGKSSKFDLQNLTEVTSFSGQ